MSLTWQRIQSLVIFTLRPSLPVHLPFQKRALTEATDTRSAVQCDKEACSAPVGSECQPRCTTHQLEQH
jgi:hypothetical protein